MKKKNLKILSKILSLFLLISFFLVGLYVWEKQVYDNAVVNNAFEVLKSNESRFGIEFKIVDNFETEEGETKIYNNFIKLGDSVERLVLVKNHHLQNRLVKFVLFDDFELKNDIGFDVNISSGNEFVLRAGEWRLLRISIFAKEDLDLGNYMGKIAVVSGDVIKYSENLNVAYGIANDFYIEVVEELPNLTYKTLIDPDLTPHKIAMGYVYSSLKQIMGLLFALFALVFLYKAFVYDLKSKK
jgi:hypothetical protein